MRKAAEFALDNNEVGNAAEFIRQCLRTFNPQRNTAKTTLIALEAIESLIAHKRGTGKLWVSVQKLFGRTTIELSAPGNEYHLLDNIKSAELQAEEVGKEARDDLRFIMLRSIAGDLKYRHKDGYNFIRLTLYKYRRLFLYKTLVAFFSSIGIALLLSAFAPESFNQGLNDYVLSPVKTIYLNTLRLIIAPVVFFSIVTCVGGFSNLRELGRIGSKTILMYVLTTIVAVLIGIGAFYLFEPGAALPAQEIAAAASTAPTADLSVMEILIGMAPSNFISPFLNDNMPQLIFLALLCGIATGLIGKYSAVLISLFDAFNELFMKIAAIIIRFMPIAIFCSMASMVLSTGGKTILSILGMTATFIFGLSCMMVFYMILMIVVGRLDPRRLFQKYAPTMMQIFSIGSSNAAIPFNMDVCQKKLGISSKICSLSIPLGSTINMHGTCIMLSVFSLTLAKIYGAPVSTSHLVTLAVLIVLLSMGAPGIPGAMVICLSVLLEQLHVPTEAVGLVMGIGPLVGMFLCMSNCLGDVVVSAIIAKKAGEMDMSIYNHKDR
ncbi:MAG: dicarboxylate/amino acid:cation symporter [Lachnospiraceae bacterium]|nr:dicarboxylate/amino acid:cation symporter [Lachnospiraceae bacterium]